MSIIVKHRTDIDLVAERVGVQARREPQLDGAEARADAGPAGPRAAKLLAFCEELRGEGVAVGTSEILDAFEALDARALDRARRLPRGAGGDDRQVAGGPARLRAALRPLLLPRRRGRGARARDPRGAAATRAASGSTSTSCARRSARRSPTATTARCATWRGSRSPPSAARARARAWSGSTCSGSAARSASRPAAARPRPTASCRRSTASRSNAFERHLRRELERALIERTEKLPPSRPLAELDRALPTSPTQDLAAVHRAVAQLKRRLATLGHEQRGRRRGRDGRRAADDARLAGDRRRAAAAALPAEAPAPARRSTCSATSRPRSPRRASSSSPSCTPCTTRSASCAASSSSSGSPR